jgi:hypothetical protein
MALFKEVKKAQEQETMVKCQQGQQGLAPFWAGREAFHTEAGILPACAQTLAASGSWPRPEQGRFHRPPE